MAKHEMKVYVDQFEKLMYLKEERMANTVWFGPLNPGTYETPQQRLAMVKAFTPSKTGLFKRYFRLRVGRRIPNRTGRHNAYLL
jgi:hypothetical protein